MKIACAACHVGQANALSSVTDLLTAKGHEISIFLDRDSPADTAHERGDLRFTKCCVARLGASARECIPQLNAIAEKMDAVLVMLSPTNSDATVERVMSLAAINNAKPAYAYSEVPCGHLAPVWRDVLVEFDTLFVAQKTDDLRSRSSVVEVGMDIPLLDHIRALATKAKLGFRENDDWIWYCGGPHSRAGDIFANLVCAVADLQKMQFPRLQLVLTRHGRDKTDPKAYAAYAQAVAIAQSLGVTFVENSADHEPGETTHFQRKEIISYDRLLEACSANGVIVTGHGTDGIKAPYLGIPSILCVGSKLNPHIKKEKGCEKLPLSVGCPMQITELADVGPAIHSALSHRNEHFKRCRELYPRQAKSPAQIITEHMIKV